MNALRTKNGVKLTLCGLCTFFWFYSFCLFFEKPYGTVPFLKERDPKNFRECYRIPWAAVVKSLGDFRIWGSAFLGALNVPKTKAPLKSLPQVTSSKPLAENGHAIRSIAQKFLVPLFTKSGSPVPYSKKNTGTSKKEAEQRCMAAKLKAVRT